MRYGNCVVFGEMRDSSPYRESMGKLSHVVNLWKLFLCGMFSPIGSFPYTKCFLFFDEQSRVAKNTIPSHTVKNREKKRTKKCHNSYTENWQYMKD